MDDNFQIFPKIPFGKSTQLQMGVIKNTIIKLDGKLIITFNNKEEFIEKLIEDIDINKILEL